MKKEEDFMKRISEISKETGLTKRTLQYYDDEGILKAQRSKDNHRLYDDYNLQKIWEILILQEMRLELKDIKSILELNPTAQKRYLKYWIEIMKNRVRELNDDIEFGESVLKNGIPKMPKEIKENISYKMQVQKLKKEIVNGELYENEEDI